MSKAQSIALAIVILCVILIAVLFATKPNDDYTSLYVASYIHGPWNDNTAEGNIVLVNPTSNSYSNLTLAIQIDSSEIINPILRLWDSNYTLNTPNSFLQSVNMYQDMVNFSTPIASINIEPNQNETISLSFPSPYEFRFSAHNLTIYLSQHSFGDIINGQLLTIPQAEAYLQIVSYSSVVTDYDTYHKYFSWTRNTYVYRNDNPNFLQRYFNRSWEIGTGNYGMASRMGVLSETYFNVTVYNNNTFPVNSITLVGQIPNQDIPFNNGRALIDYVIHPDETYVFPVGESRLPTYAYATGYVINNTVHASPTPTPTVP
jgi:hypothetical protein